MKKAHRWGGLCLFSSKIPFNAPVDSKQRAQENNIRYRLINYSKALILNLFIYNCFASNLCTS
jgi:hypothetical protein